MSNAGEGGDRRPLRSELTERAIVDCRPRVIVPGFLIHLVLAVAILVAPSVRVLCSGSCALEEGSASQMQAAVDAAADCHERGTHESSPAPLDDDCRHAGEASWSSLSASVKSVGADGPTTMVPSGYGASDGAPIRVSADRPASVVSIPGQVFGRFLIPLLI